MVLRDDGNVPKAGKPWTVEMWLTHWLHNIARPNVRDSSYSAYEVAVRKHLIPGIGAHRLDKMEPEHLEKLYVKMQRQGSKPATAHQAHRTIRTALGEAHKRRRIVRNPAAMAKAPRVEEDEEDIEPYTIEQVQRILEEAKKSRNSSRWSLALALGLRQGEALGLKWSDVDLEIGVLRVRRGRVRPKYEHGCTKPCGRQPGYCRERRQIRPDASSTKSKAGRRSIGLPEPLVELRAHKQQQDRERARARQLWEDGDWVFASEIGRPLIRRPTITNGRTCCRTRGFETAAYTTPGIRPRPFSCCSACQSGGDGNHGLVDDSDGSSLPAHDR